MTVLCGRPDECSKSSAPRPVLENWEYGVAPVVQVQAPLAVECELDHGC